VSLANINFDLLPSGRFSSAEANEQSSQVVLKAKVCNNAMNKKRLLMFNATAEKALEFG
tara:strand:- start:148 stop:324 length:177 start_codon:yes stop_codon:yes gene_type:complete